MHLALVVAYLLAIDGHAFAPIRLIEYNGDELFLAPRGWSGHPQGPVAPQTLTIVDGRSMTPLHKIAHFSAKPDNTITWDDMGLCIEAGTGKHENMVHVNLCTGGSAQRWSFVPDAHGGYVIQLRETNKCLGVIDGQGGSKGAAVELRGCEDTFTKSWRMYESTPQARLDSSSHDVAFSSKLRRLMFFVIGCAGVGILSLGACTWRRQKKTRAALIVDQKGGVCLTATVGAHEGGNTGHRTCARTDVVMTGVPPQAEVSRRTLLATVPIALGPLVLSPSPAIASGEPARPSLGEQARRPNVLALPRKKLNKDFAVLLLRSGYQIADELDFMPMDVFQKNQFIFRQNEWEEYRTKLRLEAGDLTDPAYFDFMSFVQFATTTAGMRSGQIIFEEKQEVDSPPVVVNRRAPSPMDNNFLPEAQSQRLGDRILQYIDTNFDDIKPLVLKARELPSDAEITAGIQRIADVFESNGYMLQSSIQALPNVEGGWGGQGEHAVEWTVVAPANMWGSQVLKLRDDNPNSYEVMTVLAYFRRCGIPAESKTKFDATKAVHTFFWLPSVVAS